jgi:hypothetical protein
MMIVVHISLLIFYMQTPVNVLTVKVFSAAQRREPEIDPGQAKRMARRHNFAGRKSINKLRSTGHEQGTRDT